MTERKAVPAVVSAVLACVCGVLAGCGIPPQDEPTVVEPSVIPFGLAEPRPRVPSPVDGTTRAPAFVYFVVDDRLDGVQRGLTSVTPLGQVDAVLDALATGPTAVELRAGLSSAIPPSLHLTATGLESGLLTINLSGETGPSAGESRLTVAQVVLSVTSLPDVERVQLTRDHQAIDAPLVDGSLTPAPLTALDYQRLRVPLGGHRGAERLTGQRDDQGNGGPDQGAEPVPLDDSSTSDPEQPPPSKPDGPRSDGSMLGVGTNTAYAR